MAIKAQGNFIHGSFINQGSITLTSKNPSSNFEPVFSVKTDPNHVSLAVQAAQSAYKTWTYLSQNERNQALLSLKAAFQKNEEAMAHAISSEMGKIYSEALTESKSLSARIDLMIEHGLKRIATESLYQLRAQTRYHNQGVLAVIGPYNFPAHLVNAHVIPSVLLGNTVVIKPSELCPLVGQVYAECVEQSAMPAGVINIIHGDGQMGRALCGHEGIDGVLFTGSYQTGRALKELLLDQPQKILALELGGKNCAVVMDDAHLSQACLEIVLGAFLTTGQRCTATSRVLVHKNIFDKFRQLLLQASKDLQPCKPHESGLFGPMASQAALDRFMHGLMQAKQEGAEVLLESELLSGGAFVTPSIYQIKNTHPLQAYLGEELFGPNIALESFATLDDALVRLNDNPYGLSNAIFSLDPKNAERMIKDSKSGILNINRSTNNAFGQMPFGGVKKSGNHHPAGIDAVRYATYPLAITSLAYGESQAPPVLKQKIAFSHDQTPPATIAIRHEVEAIFETYGIFSDTAALDKICFNRLSFNALAEPQKFFDELAVVLADAISFDGIFITINASLITNNNLIKSLSALLKTYASSNYLSLRQHHTLAITVPKNLELPRSRTMLDRLYKNQFVPAEKKLLVPDLEQSHGAFLKSVDDEPLVLFDAASQIATLAAGFQANTFQNAYDMGELDEAMLINCDLALTNHDENAPWVADANKAKLDFEAFLHEKSGHTFSSIAYGASGAEANEIAFDLARLHGPGGTRIIAFEGSFHGRTLMALQATYNKEKRGPFAFKGYEATFLPFPEHKDPQHQPSIPHDFIKSLSRGEIPSCPTGDELLKSELASLMALKTEVANGNICAVIIEPMQCEGGDKYASNRFFSGLRALCSALKIPLIFDEVQTGFNLGHEFFWHRSLELKDEHGNSVAPDCVTLAKKAQLGVCMSIWENSRSYSPHIIQLKRGLLHGQAVDKTSALAMEKRALHELKLLQGYFPNLVLHPRACGFAFAFDMPTKELATELIDRRFLLGFMAYIAGEKTLRFRLNMVNSEELIKRLFEKLFLALVDIRDRTQSEIIKKPNIIQPTNAVQNIKFISLHDGNFAQFREAMQDIENAAYEPGRRDTMDYLHEWIKTTDSLGVLMLGSLKGEERVAGYAIGGPLEHSTVQGPDEDPHRHRQTTFYSANITLDECFRGFGLGSLLKNEQIKRVSAMKNSDDSFRYTFMTGRNRIDRAAAMSHINDNLGAYVVNIYDNQYGEEGAQAAYYRLRVNKSSHPAKKPVAITMLDCQNGIQTPFKKPPATLMDAFNNNRLRSLACSKLTLSNWATTNMIRYSELLRVLMPKHLHHAYFTSGRDEVLDKGLRSLRFHRLDADIAIGFSHQWLGNITAAARSLSHDEGQAKPFSFFNWPKIPHPSLVGHDESLKALRQTITTHGPEKILGIVVELLGEKSALSFDDAFLTELSALRDQFKIPLVYIETAASLKRASKEVFLSEAMAVKPNMVLWYTGGQLGHVFVDDTYFVDKPLTLISTWDGDDLSMVRAYHNLLAAHETCFKEGRAIIEQAMDKLVIKYGAKGRGFFWSVPTKDRKTLEDLMARGRKEGVLFGYGFDNGLMICPKPDFSKEELLRVVDVIQKLLP